MDMAGERLIAAPRETVWAALNDLGVLKASIPGCESLEAIAENDLQARVAVKLGPIAAKFTGRVQLSDIDPPNGYTLSGEGKGGPAGFAKGAAKVRLAERAEGTLLTYTVEAQVGGKIAQLGARLIDATAKSLADQFFTRFADEVKARTTVAETVTAPPPPEAPKAGPPAFQKSIWIMLAIGVGIAILTWIFFLRSDLP